MKKILGFSSLVALLVLTACGGGGSSETKVCTVEDFLGVDATFTATVEDERVSYMEIQIDISELDEEEAELLAEILGGTIEGNYIHHSEEEDMDLDDFMEEIEYLEGSCS